MAADNDKQKFPDKALPAGGLKAVASNAEPTDDEKTALIQRRDPKSKMWMLGDALKAVETALGQGNEELPPTEAARGSRPARPAGAPGQAALPPTASPLANVAAAAPAMHAVEPKTQLVRGARKPLRSGFQQDPVVGWLVVIGGPGLGQFRPIYEGNNAIGRAASQRIPIDFGDDAISAEEQAFLRYDSSDREFLFVPNLAKTNVVSVNDSKPTGAVKLAAMDVITVGRTQLIFVPFCGDEFDWADLADLKE